MIRVHTVPSTWATSYVVETEDSLALVDAGFVHHAPAVLEVIDRIGRRPDELRLAVVTHAHPDHFGSLAELLDSASFEVRCHPRHLEALAAGSGIYSPGLKAWSRAYMAIARVSLKYIRFRGVPTARPVGDGESLHRLGLPGHVYHTPGHSEGCVSVVLDDGTALTGDLIQGPRRRGGAPELSAMGKDPKLMLASWRRLLSMGIDRVLPAHGAPHSAEQLRLALEHLEATG
jgi:hydroxyacylglutathione hydrolase